MHISRKLYNFTNLITTLNISSGFLIRIIICKYITLCNISHVQNIYKKFDKQKLFRLKRKKIILWTQK